MSNFSKIANAGRDFACGIYKLHPGALIKTPMSRLLVAVWDGLCDYPNNPGLPPPPKPDFPGGQCSFFYFIQYTDRAGELRDTSLTGEQCQGPITSIAGVSESNGFHFYVGCPDARSGQFVSENLYKFRVPNQPGPNPTTFVSWIPVPKDASGNPVADSCGSLPDKFPPAPPAPPGGYTSPPTTINFNDGSTSINVEFNFSPPEPPGVAPKNFMPPVVVNFNEFNANFKIPVEFNFDGTIKFGGGDSGGGGGGDNNFNQDDRDTINQINNTTNNTNNTTNNTSNDFDNFYSDYTRDADRRTNKEPSPDDFDPPKPPEPPGEKEVERLAFVEVNLTAIPANAKKQLGKNSDDIIYAGWFQFRRAGQNIPREPIHFANNCFVAPIGADGYAFDLYNGYQGTAIAITFKE